jgi:polysaccharide deacetylase family protein (PEP-CTERM system associated)
MHLAKHHEADQAPARAIHEADEAGLPGMGHWLVPRGPAPVVNVLTIDLEDWPIAVLGPEHGITGRVVENTKRCLQILRWHHVKATFFVLGKVAERFGALIKEVHAAGHEIASHGYGHELLTAIGPRRFEEDVRRSIEILSNIVGERPIGYRAPGFSIVATTRWAGPILSDLGFRYSSSVFPIRHRRYGIPDAPRHIHRWEGCRLIECPPATLRSMGRNWPIAGGGYFRLLPGPIARRAIRRLNKARLPAILYIHPYELDLDGIRCHKEQGLEVGLVRHLTQQLFRGRVERRLHRLCEQFRFTPMRELLKHAL